MKFWWIFIGCCLSTWNAWSQEPSTVPTAIYVGNALFEAPVEGATVSLLMQEEQGDRRRPLSTPIGKFESNNEGMVTVSLVPDKQYLVQTSKEGYFTQLSKIKTTNFSRTQQNKTGISLRPRETVSIKGNIALMDGVGEEDGRRITLINRRTNHVRTAGIGTDGNYDFEVMKDSDYDLHIYVEGLVDTIIRIGQKDLEAQTDQLPVVFNIIPGARRPNYRAGDQLPLAAYNLRFIDRTPRLSSEVWLDTLTRILRDHPEVQLTFQIHTDARKSDRLNLLLSKKRAAFLREELSERQVNAAQYEFEMKGEDEILNDCVDGVPCDKREHAINNRVTIAIKAGAFYFKDT